jgi:aminopeptidase N
MGQKKLIKNREAIMGPADVNYHYWQDSDMYYKGAWMLHSLRNSIDNDSLWFALLLNIQQTFGGKQIRSSELIQFINSFTQYDYTSFFQQYLYETELPTLEYSLLKKDEKNYKLKYRWVASVKNFSFPIVIQESNGVKKKLFPEADFKTVLINIDNTKQEFIFKKDAYYINLTQKKK